MSPLFIAGHPAVDFLNTRLAPDGQTIELIGDGASFVDWLRDAGLLSEHDRAALKRRFGVKALDDVAAEARALREWARGWLERWRLAPDAGHAKDLRVLNGLLLSETRVREVALLEDGLGLVERWRFDTTDALLALLAAQIAALVTAEEAALVKACAGPACTLWFLDRTKAHGRLFCSAAACGNRAKVAAFRERQRVRR